MRSDPRVRTGGFTLLEVLAAVLVIGMSFTVLARVNIEALRAEGIATRRLEASLLADRTLAELEAQQRIPPGNAPAVGREERAADPYRIEIEVEPLEITLAPLPPELGATPSFADRPGAPTLLSAPQQGAATPLRHVHVAVVWNDGSGEDRVVRDTFLFDAASVSGTLSAISAADEVGIPTGDEP
jgi:prepilin-type N-terminal cleavage/methylation domain-containing protein